MSVYVDPLFRCVSRDRQARQVGAKHGHLWSHLFADTLEELHAMADRIGMRRAWFQDHGRLPHYDLVPPRRAAAVAAGAIELDRRAAHAKRMEIRQATPRTAEEQRERWAFLSEQSARLKARPPLRGDSHPRLLELASRKPTPSQLGDLYDALTLPEDELLRHPGLVCALKDGRRR